MASDVFVRHRDVLSVSLDNEQEYSCTNRTEIKPEMYRAVKLLILSFEQSLR